MVATSAQTQAPRISPTCSIVSLQQMVLFRQNLSQRTLLKASQFLAEELPVRLAHRVKELDERPDNLSAMPSIKKVKKWYAQSFEVRCCVAARGTRP
ncbi:mitochondrial branched-chain alpha-ketoacid dehydrogenase kinase-domain-containing protein [Mycena capillaripes]|nr:mitochondrial branched-chain alpha-ketoacid dehydrogenase kinase-domain-containing protein [Mycena capillaripes]